MKNELVETEDRIIAALLSAPPHKADMCGAIGDVRYWPIFRVLEDIGYADPPAPQLDADWLQCDLPNPAKRLFGVSLAPWTRNSS